VFVDADETDIAPMLSRLQAGWGRRVALGSYPDWLSNYHRVRLVLDSNSQQGVDSAMAQLLEELPGGSVVPLVTDPVSIAPAEVYTLANSGEDGKTSHDSEVSSSQHWEPIWTAVMNKGFNVCRGIDWMTL